MDTFDDDITNERDFISKDIIEKSNSFAIKSVDENSFNFLELINEKFFLLITFTKSSNTLQISNKSILKIFQLFSDLNNKDTLETAFLNHITCTINPENSLGNELLDAPFVQLLKETKIYKINFTKKGIGNNEIDDIKKNLMIYDENSNKIIVRDNSIKKICGLLGKNIFDMSDYINILILYLNEDEINKSLIQNKILDKYNKSGENFYFSGTKKFETDLNVPQSNKKIALNKINNIIDKIVNKMDNVEDISDLSEDEQNNKEKEKIPRKYIEQKIKDLNEEDNLDNKGSDEEDYGIRHDKGCNCQKDFCEKCNIF